MANHLYKRDLPDGLDLGPIVAIDCETMGLNPHRDRLCVVQLSSGDGNAHLVQVEKGQTSAPNLERLLTDPDVLKLFHFGRFDIAAMLNAFGVVTAPVYCTKIASKLIRTYTDRHGLKNLLEQLLKIVEPFEKKITCIHIDTTQNRAKVGRMEELNLQLINDYPDHNIKCWLFDDTNVLHGIKDYTDQNKINLLSFTVHKRGIFEKLFKANLFKKILQESNVPILIFPS